MVPSIVGTIMEGLAVEHAGTRTPFREVTDLTVRLTPGAMDVAMDVMVTPALAELCIGDLLWLGDGACRITVLRERGPQQRTVQAVRTWRPLYPPDPPDTVIGGHAYTDAEMDRIAAGLLANME